MINDGYIVFSANTILLQFVIRLIVYDIFVSKNHANNAMSPEKQKLILISGQTINLSCYFVFNTANKASMALDLIPNGLQ